LLSEKEEILKHNDEKMERLESELKEKEKRAGPPRNRGLAGHRKAGTLETTAGKVRHFPQGLSS
jgi:hypothetical protein